ncbi:MAG: O-antigen ligase family protein [Elusimicrobiota bacterium]
MKKNLLDKKAPSQILYFAIVVCPLVFFTNVTRNPYIIQGTILHICLLLIFGLFIFQSLKNGKIIFYRTRLDLPILIFLGFTIVTFIRALLCSADVAGFGKIPGFTTATWSEGLRNNLYILINCVLVYYVAVNFIRDEKSIRKVLFLSFVVSFLASVYAILQYFDLEPIWQQTINPYSMKRCVSTFGNPVFISSFLVIMVPLSVVSFIQAKSNYSRFLYIALSVLMILALITTMARSSWLGLFVAFIFVAGVFKQKIIKYKKWLLCAGISIFLVLLIPSRWQIETKPFGFYAFDRASSIFSVEKAGPAVYQRVLIWLSAWDISKRNPVLGSGWGLFEMLFPFYQQRYLIHPKLTQRTHANNAHNVFLENLSQIGIVGLGMFLWLIYCIVKFGLYQINNLKNEFQKIIAIGIFAGVIGMLVDNIVNVTLYFIIPGFFFWMNLGILAGLGGGGTSEKKIINHSLLSKIVSLILIVLSILLIRLYIRTFFAEKNYFTGFKLAKKQNTPIEQAIPYLEKAHQLHRLEVNNNYELGNAYARMAAQFRHLNAISQAEEYQKKALWAYNEALAANPGYDEIYFNKATILAQRKEFDGEDGALVNYQRAVFINPFSLDAIMGLGNVYLFSEKYEPARNLYRRATILSPSNKDIWNNLGYVSMKLNRIDDAKKCYQKALAIDPNFELARRNLANISALPKNKKE